MLDALGPAPIDIDAVMQTTGLSPRAVQIALMELDSKEEEDDYYS